MSPISALVVSSSSIMGKRKSSAKPQKKIKQVLDTTFTCLFCNHERSVICTLDKKNSLGELNCKICGQTFQTSIHSLSQPVDVYSDWIDACEELAEEADDGDAEVEDDYSDDDGPAFKSNGRTVDSGDEF